MENIHLSPIIAGTMNWGAWDKKYTTSEMAALICVCVENSITSFDHADIYGGYTTEAEFGRGFKSSGIARDQIQLISKCGIQHTQGRPNTLKHYDYSKDYIIWSVENSLKNLQTDYLDVLLLHRPSPLMQATEIAAAVDQLKTQGKIRSFGLSNFTSSQTALICQETEVHYNQIQFSATHFQPMLDGSLDFMQLHSIKPMAWNPLGTVFREDIEQTRRLKETLTQLEAKYSVTADLLLLAWVLKHPSSVIPVAGTAAITRIRQLMKAVELPLTDLDWFAIWTASMGNKVP
jgi:predicted oxidoreductase